MKQSDLPPAVAARKTREFRCPPHEQMRAVLAFRKEDLETEQKIPCPCSEGIRDMLRGFHSGLLSHSGHPEPEPEETGEEEVKELKWTEKLLALIKSKEEVNEEIVSDERPGECLFVWWGFCVCLCTKGYVWHFGARPGFGLID